MLRHLAMHIRPAVLAGSILIAIACLIPNAQAGLNQFELVATTPTLINPGDSVSFDLIVNYSTDIIRNASYPGDAEPGPVFVGEQRWYHGGGVYESVFYNYGTARITSDAGHALQSYIGGLSTWSFALVFSDPGDYTVLADGSYVATDSYQSWDSYSTRGCFFWICGSWESHNPRYSSSYDYYGTFPSQSLVIQVVPEPESWITSLIALALIARRLRDKQTPPTPPHIRRQS